MRVGNPASVAMIAAACHEERRLFLMGHAFPITTALDGRPYFLVAVAARDVEVSVEFARGVLSTQRSRDVAL